MSRFINWCIERINWCKKQIFLSELPTFPEDTFNKLTPLFASINTYITTFLSVYSTVIFTINSALIVLILSSDNDKNFFFIAYGLLLFICSMIWYLISLLFLIMVKRYIIRYTIKGDNNISKISYKVEDKITTFVSSVFFISFFQFLAFLSFLFAIFL